MGKVGLQQQIEMLQKSKKADEKRNTAEVPPAGAGAGGAPPSSFEVTEQPQEQLAALGENTAPWASELEALAEMGFYDQGQLTRLLNGTCGNVQQVVERLRS